MEYIDKSTLVAEIESKIEKLRFNLKICKTENDRKTINLYIGCYNDIRSFIDTFEVEEVDLDKEVDDVMRRFLGHITCREEQLKFAKHFFELGLKAQKGE